MRDDAVHSAAAALLGEGVAARVFSGAQAAWRSASGHAGAACAGATRIDGDEPVDAETRFDVASLTKLLTASAALRLAAKGAIRLDAALGAHLPELDGTPQARATIEQALAHEAGFVPWAPLYEAVLVSPTSQLRLRQGETIRYAETQLEFIRSRVPPAVRYDLALAADNGPVRTLSVSPGKTVPFGAWGLSQAPPAPDPARIAVLHVELVPNRTWLKLILAASLAALVWSVLHSRREGTAPPGTPIS